MLYKMTLQTRGKKTGYYSHPKTIITDTNKDNILSILSKENVGIGEKFSVWYLEPTTGDWLRIATKEFDAE